MINAFMLLSREWTMSQITHFSGVNFLLKIRWCKETEKYHVWLYISLHLRRRIVKKKLNIWAHLSRKKWTTWDNFGSNQLQPWIFRIRLRHLINLGRSATKRSKRWKVGETSLVASKWKHLHGDWMGKRTNGQSNSWRVASCQQSNMSGSTNFWHNLNLSHLRRWDNKQAPQMPHF